MVPELMNISFIFRLKRFITKEAMMKNTILMMISINVGFQNAPTKQSLSTECTIKGFTSVTEIAIWNIIYEKKLICFTNSIFCINFIFCIKTINILILLLRYFIQVPFSKQLIFG